MSIGTTSKEQSPPPWWVMIFQQVGLPTALVCFMCYGAWSGTTWFGMNIAMPMYQKQAAFIETVERNNAAIQESFRDIATAVQVGEQSRALMTKQLELQTEVLEEIKAELKKQ